MLEYLQAVFLGSVLGGVVVGAIMQSRLDKEAAEYQEDLNRCQAERESLEADYMRMRDLIEWATDDELNN